MKRKRSKRIAEGKISNDIKRIKLSDIKDELKKKSGNNVSIWDRVDEISRMIIFPVNYKKSIDKFNISQANGVLLHGPPGTGKTMTVDEVVKTCKNKCKSIGKKINFVKVECSKIFSKWLGESEKILESIFIQAKQSDITIIFFDEIDAIAPARKDSSRNSTTYSGILSTFLVQMDTLRSGNSSGEQGRLFIIGATNKINHIDQALIRNGRFRKLYEYKYPTPDQIKKILMYHTKSWGLNEIVLTQVKEFLVNKLHKITGAYLKDICDSTGSYIAKMATRILGYSNLGKTETENPKWHDTHSNSSNRLNYIIQRLFKDNDILKTVFISKITNSRFYLEKAIESDPFISKIADKITKPIIDYIRSDLVFKSYRHCSIGSILIGVDTKSKDLSSLKSRGLESEYNLINESSVEKITGYMLKNLNYKKVSINYNSIFREILKHFEVNIIEYKNQKDSDSVKKIMMCIIEDRAKLIFEGIFQNDVNKILLRCERRSKAGTFRGLVVEINNINFPCINTMGLFMIHKMICYSLANMIKDIKAKIYDKKIIIIVNGSLSIINNKNKIKLSESQELDVSFFNIYKSYFNEFDVFKTINYSDNILKISRGLCISHLEKIKDTLNEIQDNYLLLDNRNDLSDPSFLLSNIEDSQEDMYSSEDIYIVDNIRSVDALEENTLIKEDTKGKNKLTSSRASHRQRLPGGRCSRGTPSKILGGLGKILSKKLIYDSEFIISSIESEEYKSLFLAIKDLKDDKVISNLGENIDKLIMKISSISIPQNIKEEKLTGKAQGVNFLYEFEECINRSISFLKGDGNRSYLKDISPYRKAKNLKELNILVKKKSFFEYINGKYTHKDEGYIDGKSEKYKNNSKSSKEDLNAYDSSEKMRVQSFNRLSKDKKVRKQEKRSIEKSMSKIEKDIKSLCSIIKYSTFDIILYISGKSEDLISMINSDKLSNTDGSNNTLGDILVNRFVRYSKGMNDILMGIK